MLFVNCGCCLSTVDVVLCFVGVEYSVIRFLESMYLLISFVNFGGAMISFYIFTYLLQHIVAFMNNVGLFY